ncbi:KilA-N domain-containing protein [Pedobacter caeni]|uniref:KilA-N domain-containing protein n=1 Tax=Pedobacter caeni TaxID=288992 RepID=A0A1M5NVG1_9SPHI|nr:KilA-N domain-containing protein [Pedobacter caeni]SHG93502.1 KilA-N domain-containing protein [Pedobacter caeni]
MAKINIKGTEVRLMSKDNDDRICLTDMIKAKDGDFFVSDWLRNRNTLEFLSVWEKLNKPNFNYGEFAIIASKAGLNNFKISVKDWIEKTGAVGVSATAGRYGGTYAHKDIAFEFGMWISPEFKLILITEYQKLKQEEAGRLSSGWDFRRFLVKTNYTIHTDAIKEHIIPELTEEQSKYVYSSEADMLNVALFGLTAKEWKDQNLSHAKRGLNMRDLADIHQLIVLSNLENNNAYLIEKGMSQEGRLLELRKIAVTQLKSLRKSSYTTEKIQAKLKKSIDKNK